MSYKAFYKPMITITPTVVVVKRHLKRALLARILPIILIVLFLFSSSLAWSEHTFVHEITVDPSQPNAYPINTNSIGLAVYWAFNNDIGNTIVRVAAGNFPSFVACPTNKANRVVKIVGTMFADQYQTIVSGPTDHQALVHVRESYYSPGSTLIIEDICIQGSPGGIRVFDDGYEFKTHIYINHCKFEENAGWSIKSPVPISIINCLFEAYNNYAACQGAILINGYEETDLPPLATIKDNIFTGNYYENIIRLGDYSAFSAFHHLNSADILNNKFDVKFTSNGNSNWRPGAIQVAGVQTLNIKRNVFRIRADTNPGDLFQLRIYEPHRPDLPIEDKRVAVVNNTFITSGTDNNISAMGIDKRFYSVSILNNVISNLNGTGIQFFNNNLPNYTYAVQNNIIHNCFDDILNASSANGWLVSGQIDSDPLLDANEQPIWSNSAISSCIDAGFGDPDPDGTPSDIGAIPAIQHRYWEYTFENQADRERWYWVSYPVLNSVTYNALKASEFFKELLHTHQSLVNGQVIETPTYLDTIKWVVGGTADNIIWVSDEWFGPMSSHFVSSPQGYKIQLRTNVDPQFPWPVYLVESGFKTADNTQFPINGGVENWLGYFSDVARMPQDAFAAIWDDITMIKAKDWSLFRLPKPGNYWGMQGRVMPIKSGDMVILQTNNNHTFQWGTQNPIPPESKVYPKSFVYDEKQDYIPVFISLPDSLMPDLKEIGLYVDGICKGAVVVKDSLEQISAYVDCADELTNGNVEFVFCYEEGKRQGSNLRAMNLNPGRLQAQHGVAGAAYPYFEIKITPDDMNSIVPPEFALKQNYPNPFNPATTIAYSLPEASKVRLDIYNLKGQLVKTLVNAEMSTGLHRVVWNGKDKNNVAVASGVYFYRISSPNQNQTKRMLLMK